jgi:KAP-like P-loop domain-containing protein
MRRPAPLKSAIKCDLTQIRPHDDLSGRGSDVVTHNQHLDDPAVRQEDDAFNRWPFSERLADTIANFDTSSGAPVIGIYGKWGSGKTSVLNFLRTALADKYGDKIVLHPFNPWLFKDPETLLQSFFAELGKAMQKSNKTLGDNVGKLLQDYSGLFGLVPVVGSALGKIAEQSGKALTRSMEEVRDRVCEVMRTAEKKVVVLIDDLDRLDHDEVLQMLKLVRLTANFPNVVYLLAFDDEMVGRAIAKKYGNDDDAGRQFLEKIIQYPFTLPAVSRLQLMTFVENQAKMACEQAAIVLTQDEWEGFQVFTTHCFPQRLTTPRQAIRYGNRRHSTPSADDRHVQLSCNRLVARSRLDWNRCHERLRMAPMRLGG